MDYSSSQTGHKQSIQTTLRKDTMRTKLLQTPTSASRAFEAMFDTKTPTSTEDTAKATQDTGRALKLCDEIQGTLADMQSSSTAHWLDIKDIRAKVGAVEDILHEIREDKRS
jgi:hypothetical protein